MNDLSEQKRPLSVCIAYPDVHMTDLLVQIVARALRPRRDLEILATSYVSEESHDGPTNGPPFELLKLDRRFRVGAFIVGVNRPSTVEVMRELARLQRPILAINTWSFREEFVSQLEALHHTEVISAPFATVQIGRFLARNLCVGA